MGGQFIHRFCKYKKSRKMLSRFYAVFATVHKIDPSRTVGIAAFVFLKKSGPFFSGAQVSGAQEIRLLAIGKKQ